MCTVQFMSQLYRKIHALMYKFMLFDIYNEKTKTNFNKNCVLPWVSYQEIESEDGEGKYSLKSNFSNVFHICGVNLLVFLFHFLSFMTKRIHLEVFELWLLFSFGVVRIWWIPITGGLLLQVESPPWTQVIGEPSCSQIHDNELSTRCKWILWYYYLLNILALLKLL